MDKPTAPAEPEAQGERDCPSCGCPKHPGDAVCLSCVLEGAVAKQQAAESELAELRAKLQETNNRLRIASESNDLAVAKLQAAEAELAELKASYPDACDKFQAQVRSVHARAEAAEAELAHTREAAELLREARDVIVFNAKASFSLLCSVWYERDQKRASATTEERTKSVDDDCPPGGRRVDVYLSGDRQTLAFPGGAFTTVRACRHCGVLITGGPTACVHCVALAEAAESKGAKT